MSEQGKYKTCPQCGSTEAEYRDDARVLVRHYLCLKCNRAWEVPLRVVEWDLPYEPK